MADRWRWEEVCSPQVLHLHLILLLHLHLHLLLHPHQTEGVQEGSASCRRR